MTDIKKSKDDFDEFLFKMDDQLDALDDRAKKHGIQLEFSMNSLEKLESLFFKIADDVDDDTRASLIVTFARYVGEIVRLSFGGKWKLSLDDPKNIYYNSPVIVGHTPISDLEFSPIDAMQTIWLRRKPGLLRQIIMAGIGPEDLDIDHLVEK